MAGFKGWQQIAATMVLQAASSGSILFSYSVIAASLQPEFQPSRMLLMMAVTATLIGSGVLSPLLGRAMERTSLRRLMLIGSTILSVGFMLVSRTQSMYQVLVAYLVCMSTASVLTGPIAGSALLARWFSKRRGLAMSLSAAGAAVGGLIAPPLLQMLIESLGWRMALLMYGVGLLVVTLPVTALFVIDRPSDIGQFPDGADMAREQPTHAAANPGLAFYLKDRNFWLLGIALGLVLASSMGISSNMLQYAAEHGINAARGAYLLSIYAVANFVGKVGTGALADKFNPMLLLSLIIVLFTASVLCFAQFTVYRFFVIASVMRGLSQGGLVPLWSVMMARLYGPDRVGSSMGMMNLLLTPLILVAPPLFGLVSDKTGSYYGAYMGCVGLLLPTILLVSRIRERHDSGKEPPLSFVGRKTASKKQQG